MVIQKNSKGYIFYYPNHSMRIVESSNARFLENDEINGGEKSRRINFDIEEIQVNFLLSSPIREIIVPQINESIDEGEQ